MSFKTTCAIGFMILAALGQASYAETVEAYSAAMGEKGCMAIPYSSLKEKCITHQSDVKLWCDGKGSRTCDESGLRSDSFLNKIRELENGIREKGAQNKPDEVRDLEGKKKDAENNLASARKEVERRREITLQCIQYRELVQGVFDSAVKRVESERSDSRKAAVHAALDTIKTILSGGKGDHNTQIQEARKSEEICKKQL